jgi:hypothetical protein
MMEETENKSVDESIQSFIDFALMNVHTVQPGFVTKYENGFASVQPIFKTVFEDFDGQEVIKDKPIIENVPVLMTRGGGFFINLPIKKGDLVLLIFAERSIDSYIQTDGKNSIDPEDSRAFDLSDCLAIPGGFTFKNKPGTFDSDNFIITSEDDNTQIGLESNGEVYIKSSKVKIGDKTASQALALATETQSRLDAIQTGLNSHVHVCSTPGSNGSSAIPITIGSNDVSSGVAFTNG